METGNVDSNMHLYWLMKTFINEMEGHSNKNYNKSGQNFLFENLCAFIKTISNELKPLTQTIKLLLYHYIKQLWVMK